MAERRIALALLCTALGCEGSDVPLLLEQVCNQPPSGNGTPACRLSGDAQESTGLTGDAIAFRFGPNGGALDVRLNALSAAMQATWSLEVLAAARPLRPEGNLLVRKLDFANCDPLTCPEQPVDAQAPLGESFQWARMVDELPGSNFTFIPDTVTLTLAGADIDIVDMRTPGFEPVDGALPVPAPR